MVPCNLFRLVLQQPLAAEMLEMGNSSVFSTAAVLEMSHLYFIGPPQREHAGRDITKNPQIQLPFVLQYYFGLDISNIPGGR